MSKTERLEFLERISRTAQSVATHLRVRSALNPALWMCVIVTLPSLLGAFLTNGAAQIVYFSLAFVPVLLASIGFLFFMVKDRDRLQSEDFRIQQQALELIEEKGGKVPIALASIQAIANPRARELGSGEQSEGEHE